MNKIISDVCVGWLVGFGGGRVSGKGAMRVTCVLMLTLWLWCISE